MTTESPVIRVPEEFAFEWDSPEEAGQFWTPDLMHWPNGISPLAATMDMPAFNRGMNTASNELCMPFSSVTFKHIRGYIYTTFTPYSFDPGEMQERMGQMQGKMMQHVPGLLERWRTTYEPEVRSMNDETLMADYTKLGDGDLAALFEQLVAKREREGELHFLAVFPAGGGVQFFEQVYAELFGAPRNDEHLQLLQGFPNKSLETDTGLWQLAQEARKRPPVLDMLQRVEPSQARTALNESDDGRAFVGAVDEFLDTYGWRSNELDIGEPTWKEEPATAFSLIRQYAAREDYDPEREMKSLVAAREARQKLLLEKLSGQPEKAGMFEQVLAGAQQYLPIQEDHNFWIDQQGVAVERVPSIEAGRRFVASGRLADARDVFFLYYDELQDALRGGKGDLRELVVQRKRERAESRTMTPPQALGTALPPEAADNPMVSKFFGAPPEQNPDPRIINGNAASAGKLTGTARVIRSLDDSHRLSPGEILVCPATNPPWTPLFGVAAAVVTDHGGVLSHTAIVAREYRIPAVIGTKVATSLIRDGQTITVDGTEGTVKLEDA
ncbi:MAG: PEP-utilizing enzyme [Dehalococcoidia bacterium]